MIIEDSIFVALDDLGKPPIWTDDAERQRYLRCAAKALSRVHKDVNITSRPLRMDLIPGVRKYILPANRIFMLLRIYVNGIDITARRKRPEQIHTEV